MNKSKLNDKINQEKILILEDFLKNASFDGWSELSLIKSAQNCNFDKDYYKLLFPQGISDLTDFFYNHTTEKMTNIFLAQENAEKLKIREKIAFLIEIRINIYSSYKESIRSLLTHNLYPQNILNAQLNIWKICDQIWFLAGDKSTDFNYYSKRALLEGVYSSSVLFWLEDNSDDWVETKSFIAVQIARVLKIGKFSSELSSSIKNFYNNLFN